MAPEIKHNAVTAHYSIDDLPNVVMEALKKAKGGLSNLKVHDLAPIDGFHIRGRESTMELAGLLRINPTDQILDVGSGLGGAARYLASQYDCQVIGLDLTPAYVELAGKLSRLVGFEGRTRFECGNALEMPFEDENFDIVWTEHVQMNVPDKRLFSSEAFRVLTPHGHLAIHEVFKGEQGEPYLPAPWSSEKSMSFTISAHEMKQVLKDTGFKVIEWRDVTDISLQWFNAMLERLEAGQAPALGLHLLMGANAKEKILNVWRSLAEGRARVILAVLEKAGNSTLLAEPSPQYR